MSFDFEIKADPAQAIRAAKQTEEALGKVEATARALERAGTNAFSGIAAAMTREAEVLERIRGPLEEHKRDMQALESLYRRGVVSMQEYNAERARMAAGAPGARPAGGGGGILNQVAGFAAGQVTAQAAIGLGREVIELGTSYENLENRLRSVTTTQYDLDALMDKTRAIAGRTRSDWNATGEAFTRLTTATKSMGLAQEHVLSLTETLSKASKLQGASSSESAAAMLQLSQAFASGVLQGDEFRSIAEQMPILLDYLAKSMGVSRGELKQLGADGKITADALVRAFDEAAPEVNRAFERMKPTVADVWTQFKNDAEKAAGDFSKNAQLADVFKAAMGELTKVMTDLGSQIGSVVTALKNIGSSEVGGDAMKVLGVARDVSRYLDPIQWTKWSLSAVGAWTGITEKQVDWLKSVEEINKKFETMREKGADMWRGLAAGADEFGRQIEHLGGVLGGFFDGIGGEIDMPAMKMKSLAERIREAAEAQRKFLAETRELRAILDSAVPKDQSAHSRYLSEDFHQTPLGEMSRDEFLAYQAAAEKLEETLAAVPGALRGVGSTAAEASAAARQVLVDLPKQAAARYEEWEQRATDSISGVDRALKKIRAQVLDIGATVENTVVSSFDKLNDTLADGFATGKFAWEDFAKQMERDLIRLAIQILEMKLLLAAFGAGAANTGGGVAGFFGALFGGSHASGGSWTAPSGGGPDSHLVMARVSPRERLDFVPEGGGRSAGRTVVQVRHDPRELLDVLPTARGAAVVSSVIRRNPGLLGSTPIRRRT